VKYLVLGETSGKYEIKRSFDNLTEAMMFAMKNGLIGKGLIVKVIENWRVIEK